MGAGIRVAITPGPIAENISFEVNLNGLNNGVHLLSVRAKNANNQWPATDVEAFTQKDNIVSIGTILLAFCRETVFDVPFEALGAFNVGNVFSLQLSNASVEFTSPTILGTSSGNSTGTISATIPIGVTVAPGYRLRIVASDPSDDEQSLIVFEVLKICPPPFAMLLTLQSNADDYSSGIVLKEVSNSNGIITATNKISGTYD